MTNLSIYHGTDGNANFGAHVESGEDRLIAAYHVYAGGYADTSTKPHGSLVQFHRILPKIAQETTQHQRHS